MSLAVLNFAQSYAAISKSMMCRGELKGWKIIIDLDSFKAKFSTRYEYGMTDEFYDSKPVQYGGVLIGCCEASN